MASISVISVIGMQGLRLVGDLRTSARGNPRVWKPSERAHHRLMGLENIELSCAIILSRPESDTHFRDNRGILTSGEHCRRVCGRRSISDSSTYQR